MSVISWHRSIRLVPAAQGVARALLVLGLAAIVGVVAFGSALPSAPLGPVVPSGARLSSADSPAVAASTPSLNLGIATMPTSICLYGATGCSAGTDIARVTLSASPSGNGVVAWPSVQVAFVLETTPYDGVYDPYSGGAGSDACTRNLAGDAPLCEESNGVPFFIANAAQIATSIQVANPHSRVSFALVDYFATLNNWDDGDGAEYHVDIPQFIPAADFGQAVRTTFVQSVLAGGWIYTDSDLADNFLHSSSITALYGTIIGSGLNWANDTHHVIVWMGSTAPRDPGYPVNYCVSPSVLGGGASPCIGSTCEPAYGFANGISPTCEGWVRSQDGNTSHSIAALSHDAASCRGSIGSVCTIDTIDLWTTPTDPYSVGWSVVVNNLGGGPGGPEVVANAARILAAGCDLAHATGGTWAGPSWASCPDGTAGNLQYIDHGPATHPNTYNPSLLNAFRQVGFGPVLKSQVAGGTDRPIFTFIPFGSIALAPDLRAVTTCMRAGAPFPDCAATPLVAHVGALTYLAWNWSKSPATNALFIGDSWSAAFNVIATGPPYARVPVDACVTTDCRAAGSAPVFGLYTSATFVPATNDTVIIEPFPLSQVTVVAAPGSISGVAPPPPPAAPPPFAIPNAPPVPLVQGQGVGYQIGVANVSLQALAAGFLGAGFMRVGIKNRTIAMRVASKSGLYRSRFDPELAKRRAELGRFE